MFRRNWIRGWPLALLTLAGAASCGRSLTAINNAPRVSAVELAPELREMLGRGSALSLRGEQDSARSVYEQALVQWPDEYHVHAGLGTILDLSSQFDDARSHWDRAIELAAPSQLPTTYQQLAVSLAFECRADEAARFEREAIRVYSARGEPSAAAAAYNEQARIFLECGNTDQALAWYRMGYSTALTTRVLSDTARSLWDFRWEHAQARVAARRGDSTLARSHLAVARTILDGNRNEDQRPALAYLSGYISFFAGDMATAITELRRTSQTDPFVLALLARAFEARGEDAEAREYWRKAGAIHGHGLTVAFSRRWAARSGRS